MKFLPKDIDPSPTSDPYRYFQVDKPPVIKSDFTPIPFDEAKEQYFKKHHKPVTPVRRHKGKSIPKDTSCPRCGAGHEYQYDNNGKGTQFLCKVCDFKFVPHKTFSQQVKHYCPHCDKTLEAIKERSNYTIYKCRNNQCSFYTSNKKSMTKEERKEFKKSPYKFKLHYITRVFDATLEELKNLSKRVLPSKVELSKIRNTQYVLGLTLTYYVNYGLSLRKTALILREVHDIRISHQTIANYAEAASHVLSPWLEDFQYDLTDYLCADETYIKVLGKKAYVFFVCDVKRKIITSYSSFMKRDSFSAIQTIFSTLKRYGSTIPKTLNIVVDGNPIYKVAQQFFGQRRLFFKVTPVIGLSNDDPVSTKYRGAKQVIERLNRTFKYSYAVKNGFKDLESSNDFMCLFTTYFNFLRRHQSLGYKTPVKLESIDNITNMPQKWLKLLEGAMHYLRDLNDTSLS